MSSSSISAGSQSDTSSRRSSDTPSNISTCSAETFAELLSGPLIQIAVGPDRRTWHLHQNLLRHHSRFFDDTLINGEEKRIKDGTLELPDEDVKAFRIFVKWLYQGKIDDVSTLKEDEKWNYAFSCQNLYLLCERIGVHQLQNLAIDQFRKGCAETRLVPGADEINPIYARLPAGSPFRLLVSRIAARQIMDPDSTKDASTYRDCLEAYPSFAIDVLNAIRIGTGGMLLDDPTEGNACRYHKHENGITCQKSVHFKTDD